MISQLEALKPPTRYMEFHEAHIGLLELGLTLNQPVIEAYENGDNEYAAELEGKIEAVALQELSTYLEKAKAAGISVPGVEKTMEEVDKIRYATAESPTAK